MHYIVIALIVLGIIGGFAGYGKGRNDGFEIRDGQCKVQIAEIDKRLVAAEREATSLREQTRALSDRLSDEYDRKVRELQEMRKRYESTINQLASAHRVALRTELARVLNTNSTVREYRDGQAVPASGGTATDPGSAPAVGDRHTGGSSERAVALWIVNAREKYDACVNQVKALVAWADGVSQ